MSVIMPKITSLKQYLKLIAEDPHQLCPERCPYCGKAGLNYHGCYYRKPDRENKGACNLNPIPITRFLCCSCGRTCSVLPECIPPRRWYIWKIQQVVLERLLSGECFRHIAKQVTPSRSTIARWWHRLKERYPIYRMVLCSRFSWLGYSDEVQGFWKKVMEKMALSAAMLVLNAGAVIIP